MDVTASYSKGTDTYTGEGHEFGLLDNENANFTITFDFTPIKAVDFGFSYGRDSFVTNQKSRNANPPPDPTFTDPSRDWTLKNDEKVNNWDFFVSLPKLVEHANVKVNYDYSDSDNGFLFGGPRIPDLAAIGQFIPLPNVTNKWQKLAADFQYRLTRKWGLAIGYWYEKFEVSDFATIDLPGQPGVPRIDYLGEI